MDFHIAAARGTGAASKRYVSKDGEASISLTICYSKQYSIHLNHKRKTLTIQTHYSIDYNISVRQSNRNVNTFLTLENINKLWMLLPKHI